MESRYFKLICILVACLLFTAPSWAANDFSSSNCISCWNFENDGDRGEDSVGTNEATESGSPAYNTGTILEGSDTPNLDDSDDYYWVTSPSSTTPGDNAWSQTHFTVLGHFEGIADSDWHPIINIWNGQVNKRAWAVMQADNNKLRFQLRLDGVNLNHDHSTTLVAGRHYHFAARYIHNSTDDNDIEVRLCEYDSGWSCSTSTADTAQADMDVQNQGLGISYYKNDSGTVFNWSGEIDEIVIFNGEVVSDTDHNYIRDGTYPSGVVAGFFPLVDGGPVSFSPAEGRLAR